MSAANKPNLVVQNVDGATEVTLTQIAGPNLRREGPKPQSIVLAVQPTVIGSGAQADLRIESPAIAERHAEVSIVDGTPRVKDLGTTAGTFVNFIRIGDAAQLRQGDVVSLGPKVLFMVGKAPPTTREVGDRAAAEKPALVATPSTAIPAAPEKAGFEAIPRLATPVETPTLETPALAKTPTYRSLSNDFDEPTATQTSAKIRPGPPPSRVGTAAGSESRTATGAKPLPAARRKGSGGADPAHTQAVAELLRRLEGCVDPIGALDSTLEVLRWAINTDRLFGFMHQPPEDPESPSEPGDPLQLVLLASRGPCSEDGHEVTLGVVNKALQRQSAVTDSERPNDGLTSDSLRAIGGPPASVPRETVCAALRVSMDPIGILYLDRPATEGPFSLAEIDLVSAVAQSVGTHLELVETKRKLLEWVDAYEQLTQACQIVLPKLALLLEGDFDRLDALASNVNGKDSAADLALRFRQECSQMRVEFNAYLRWLRGEGPLDQLQSSDPSSGS